MKSTAFPTEGNEPKKLQYLLTSREGAGESLTIFRPGETPVQVGEDHPKYQTLKDGVVHDTLTLEEAVAMVDMSIEVAEKFEQVSDRVAVRDGHLFFDGDPVHNVMADHILRCLEAGLEDYKPLVKFMEKLAQNPTDHSRDQAYEWLTGRDFTITADGDFLAYKGVRKDANGEYVSIHSGPGIVNGKAVNGHVPNPLGGVIEIGRSQVNFDPSQGCSTGLHVGSYDYAHSFANGALLLVKVNPRDVVSVPTDCNAEKMRVCRYEVIKQIDAPETEPVAFDPEYYAGENDWDEDVCYCEDCGEECEYGEELCEACAEAEAEVEALEEDRDWNRPITPGQPLSVSIPEQPRPGSAPVFGDTAPFDSPETKGKRYVVKPGRPNGGYSIYDTHTDSNSGVYFEEAQAEKDADEMNIGWERVQPGASATGLSREAARDDLGQERPSDGASTFKAEVRELGQEPPSAPEDRKDGGNSSLRDQWGHPDYRFDR